MATVNLFGDLALDASVQETNDKLDTLTGAHDTVATSDQRGIAALAVRHDSDLTTISNGDLSLLQTDEEGRLKISAKTASFSVTTGGLTTSGVSLSVDVRRASNVVFHVKNTGTVSMAAGAFSFEASVDSTDGTDGTWFAIQAVRSNANTIETGTGTLSLGVAAGLAYSWEASVNAYQYLRIRCTTTVTTSSIAFWTVQRGAYATEPIPAAQVTGTQTISGTVTANTATGTMYNLVTAATTNAAAVKTSAGNLYELTIANPTATPAYLKLYNKASAPTVGTDVPIATIPILANDFQSLFFGAIGKRLSTGIAIAVTGAIAATDTTVTVAGIQINATYA